MCAHEELNLDFELRRLTLYPLSYGREFNNFQFSNELIVAHYIKFFKKNELEKFTDLAANSLALFKKEKGPKCLSAVAPLAIVDGNVDSNHTKIGLITTKNRNSQKFLQ